MSEREIEPSVLYTGRNKRYIEYARRIAEKSQSPDYRHGALLVKGGQVINSSYNKNSYKGWATRFRDRFSGHATHHAELGCILGVDRANIKGSTIYVARIGKKGDLRMSKPCPMCTEILKNMGVRKVVYSISEGQIDCEKL